MELRKKMFLNDGVYIQNDGFYLWLTAENGIETTDRIGLDATTLNVF